MEKRKACAKETKRNLLEDETKFNRKVKAGRKT